MNKSLSAIAAEYKNTGIDRAMILQLLVDMGLMSDIRTVTEKGLLSGISYQKGDNGGCWPVYNESIQKFINDSVESIKTKYSYNTPDTSEIENNKENIEEVAEGKYITTLAKDLGLNRKALEEYLISEGYIIDIRQETMKGASVGILKKTNFKGTPCLVYGEPIQKIILNDISKIAKVNKRDKNVSVKEVTKDETLNYPYLGLDEFVIIDTETTGLEEDDEVIELSIIDMYGVELFHSRFCPEKEVNIFANKVNHLTKAMLLNEPRFVTMWGQIKNVINGKKILGHNIAFDKRLIQQTLFRQRYANAVDDVDAQFQGMIDSKTIAKTWIESKSYSLNNITTLVGITREEQHSSTDDCLMTLEFINRLEDIIKVKTEYDFVKIG